MMKICGQSTCINNISTGLYCDKVNGQSIEVFNLSD